MTRVSYERGLDQNSEDETVSRADERRGSGALTVMLSPYDERERIAEVRVAGRRPGLLMAEMIFLAC